MKRNESLEGMLVNRDIQVGNVYSKELNGNSVVESMASEKQRHFRNFIYALLQGRYSSCEEVTMVAVIKLVISSYHNVQLGDKSFAE